MRRWTIAPPRHDAADATPAAGAETGSHASVDEVSALLLEGGVALLPTDTIYGLHAVATDAAAVDRIAAMKGREETKPFVVIAADLEQLGTLGVVIPHHFRAALESIWPAPLTAVFSLRAPLPASRGAPTLAVRIPAFLWLRQVMLHTGPLASTSANRSGEPAITVPSALARGLHDAVDAIVDAGPLTGEASLIVDFTGEEPRVLRDGELFFTQAVRKRLWKSL